MAAISDTSKYLFILMLVFTIIACFEAGSVEAQSGFLPLEEKNALHEIAEQLGKRDWNFSLNPCDGNPNWNTSINNNWPLYNNSLICDCSYPGGVCHVEKIYLKGQDLAGVLPPSLAKLPYLKIMDFSRNYLSGTIPQEWASMKKLEYMSFIVNRISGPIPKFLGSITTLIYMSLEENMFSGSVPAELGKLVNLNNLILSANNLTGELPSELNNLSNLTELRLSSNNFTGKLPSFESWKQLQMLEIRASGLEGPIPPSISVLRNLIELRISDLNGGGSEFPQLRNMTAMKRLILRSCNISGKIPDYLDDMTELQMLDLSFNNLEGVIPTNLERLESLEFMYLTSNFLTGPILEWMNNRAAKFRMDLSYNNFSESSVPPNCNDNLNLFRSYSSGNNSELGKCLGIFPCSKDHYSMHINCGGGKTTVGNTNFEADEDPGGSAKLFHMGEYWGSSSTGDFWGPTDIANHFIANNVSVLRMKDPELYMTARLSPLSLTYYGHCLANGKYTVKLYFAEIIFRDNRSFQSLGRRFFDIYVQDELKLSNFDIEKEAQGVDKAVNRTFKAVVKDKSLSIRFRYTDKGTTATPSRGTYGPLISAISVTSDFKPPSNGKKKIFIACGTVALGLCLILIVLGIAWRKGYLGGRTSREQELRGLELQTGVFTFRQIRAATNNFDAANKIGEGGFGSVYKGILLDGTIIAVKQLSSKSKQGSHEFVNEIGIISGLQHPNLVRLYGCCADQKQLLLVYEFMENNSLAQALFGPEERQLDLDWPTRQRICIGIASGLAFLHEESILKIVHRDIKATNILLDRELNPKISDFGLAKLDNEENTHISTRVGGTIGYMAPEYALWGYLTYKADVYSFGVVALELVAGKNNMKYRPNENFVCLLDWALVLQQNGRLTELVDPRLGSNLNKEEAMRMIKVALLCTNPSPALRPTMSSVVGMLKGHIRVQELTKNPSIFSDELKFQGLRDKYDYELQVKSLSESEISLHPSDITKSGSSSTSAHDLYSANLYSQ